MQSLTERKFTRYEHAICKRMGFTRDVWRIYQSDITTCFGEYDETVTYAGAGDSRTGSITEVLVPELYDNFIYYVHDGFYKLIREDSRYKCFKNIADDIMEEMMEIAADKPTLWPEIYRFFVGIFG